MAETVQINLLINAAQSAKTLNQLEKSLADINEELKNTEVGSEAFKRLKQQADATAKSINQINISGFESKLKGFEATTKTISSSLALATGSMALFGTESEETTKALQRVQGALAISTAFKDFAEAQKAADESGKGLNKTLLGNPFILILSALLPLLLQMDGFKEIMTQIGGVAKELFAALKPLIDAFLQLLNSVFKALLPIISQLAGILVKALQPILKIIVGVVKALNPLFEELGKFLSENTFLVDALTTALELTLLPLNLLIQGLEAVGVIDTSKPAEGIKKIEENAEEAKARLDALLVNLNLLFEAADRKVKIDEEELSLLQAKGASEETLSRKRLEFLKQQRIQNERILDDLDLQIKVAQQQKKDVTELQKLRDTAFNRYQEGLFRIKVAEAQDDRERRERNKKRTEDLQKAADEIQKSYLDLRGIQQEISEEFTTKENERFLGFFVDYRKRISEVVGSIPEGVGDSFDELKNYFEQTFKEPNSFTKFLEKYQAEGDGFVVSTNQISNTFKNFTDDLDNVYSQVEQTIRETVTDPAVLENYTKLLNGLRKTTNDVNKLILTDALVYDKRIEATIGDLRKDPNSVLNFLSIKFTEFKKLLDEGFNFIKNPIRSTEYRVLQRVLQENIDSINFELNDRTKEFTIIQRQRLEETRNALINFRDEYEKNIKEFPLEDLQNLIRKPLLEGVQDAFSDLQRGSNETAIQFRQLDQALTRITGFDEYVSAVRDSLLSLGFDYDTVQKQISKVQFDILTERNQQLELFTRKELESATLSARERERLLKNVFNLRIDLLNTELTRAEELAQEEIRRSEKVFRDKNDQEQKLLKKQYDQNLITLEEFEEGKLAIQLDNEDLLARRIEVVEKEKAEIIKQIEKDTTEVIKAEQLRRIQAFADGFQQSVDFVTQTAQITNDILENLSQQLLINLEKAFQTQQTQLEALKNQGILTQREFDFERLKSQEKYEARRKKLEKEAWERNYAIQLGQSIINTAVAVTQALAQFPGPPFTIPNSIIAGVLGAAQTAVIATQPKPAFREGGYVMGRGTGDDDTIQANISAGEFVVNSIATKRFLPLLRQLNQYDRPTIGQRETVSSPSIPELGAKDPIRAYVVLDELNEKNELLRRINDDNTFFRN